MEMHGENSYESIKCVGEEEATVAPSAAVAPDGVYVNNFLTMGRCGATWQNFLFLLVFNNINVECKQANVLEWRISFKRVK